MQNDLVINLNKLHTTELGAIRIKRNIGLDTEDVVVWCRHQIENADSIVRQGKNWYARVNNITITVNAHNYSLITAHRGKAG